MQQHELIIGHFYKSLKENSIVSLGEEVYYSNGIFRDYMGIDCRLGPEDVEECHPMCNYLFAEGQRFLYDGREVELVKLEKDPFRLDHDFIDVLTGEQEFPDLEELTPIGPAPSEEFTLSLDF